MDCAIRQEHEAWTHTRFGGARPGVEKLPRLDGHRSLPAVSDGSCSRGEGWSAPFPPVGGARSAELATPMDAASSETSGDATSTSPRASDFGKPKYSTRSRRPRQEPGDAKLRKINSAIARDVEDRQAEERELEQRRAPALQSARAVLERGPSATGANSAKFQGLTQGKLGLSPSSISVPSYAFPPSVHPPTSPRGVRRSTPQGAAVPLCEDSGDAKAAAALLTANRPLSLMDGLISGPTVSVLSEATALLEELGVTQELMVGSGLTAAEARRLLQSIFVYSTGFLQMLHDSFNDLSGAARDVLLEKVWAGFAMMIERVNLGGNSNVTYTSSMANMERRHRIEHEQMEQERESIRADLLQKLARAREETTDALRQRDAERERAEAAEGQVSAAQTAQIDAENRTAESEKALRLRTTMLEEVQAKLEMEMKTAVPLRAQANALPAARADAAQAHAFGKQLKGDLAKAQEEQARLLEEANRAEKEQAVFLVELEDLEEALHRSLQSNSSLVYARDQMATQLSNHIEKVQQDAQAEELRRKAEREAVAAMKKTLDEAESTLNVQKRARAAAEAVVEEKEGKIAQLESNLESSAEQLENVKANLTSARELVREREAQISQLNQQIEDEKKKLLAEKKATKAAVNDANAANSKARDLLEQINFFRESAKKTSREIEIVRSEAWAELEAEKAETARVLAEMENIASARESLQEQLFISESRCSKFEAEIAHIERTASDRERAYHDTIAAQRRQAMLARKDFEIETSRAERERQQEQRCLAQAVEAIRNLGSCFESLRADVALLTTDNECLTAELQKQHDEMFLVYELKFSLDVANSISEQLAAVGEQVGVAFAMQANQVRCLDSTRDGLESCLDELANLSALGEYIQPRVEAAADDAEQLPQLKEDYERVCSEKASTLAELRKIRDAAEEERRLNIRAVQRVSMQAAKEAETSKAKLQMKESQIANMTHDLAEANEELVGWRSGNIRLANYKQWRAERAGKLGSVAPQDTATLDNAEDNTAQMPEAEESPVVSEQPVSPSRLQERRGSLRRRNSLRHVPLPDSGAHDQVPAPSAAPQGRPPLSANEHGHFRASLRNIKL